MSIKISYFTVTEPVTQKFDTFYKRTFSMFLLSCGQKIQHSRTGRSRFFVFSGHKTSKYGTVSLGHFLLRRVGCNPRFRLEVQTPHTPQQEMSQARQ